MNTQTKSVNFLRGVPAEEALSHLIPMAAEGYEKAIRHYGTEVLQYGHFSGFNRLRDLVARMHRTDPARIIAGNGGIEIISLFFKSLPRESSIIIEESTYDRVVFDAERYGHKLIGVRMSPEGVNITDLEKAIKKVTAAAFYGIPFHHNPTGISYSSENRKTVEEICRKHGILCMWDICYENLRYDGRKNEPISIAEWGPILISSFTKTISPGTKCGYMVLPLDRVEYTEKVVTNSRLNPNLPTQAFIADFIESGKYEKYLDFLHELYKPRMEALNQSLRIHFPGAFSTEVCGGFFATLSLKKVTPDREKDFISAAKQAGVSIASGWGAVAPNLLEEKQKSGLFIRLTFPASAPEQIAWGIAKLKETEEDLK